MNDIEFGDLLDPLSLIGVLMGRTSRIRFMTNVTNLPTRPPAQLVPEHESADQIDAFGRLVIPRVRSDR